jgi:hypothetical protein
VKRLSSRLLTDGDVVRLFADLEFVNAHGPHTLAARSRRRHPHARDAALMASATIVDFEATGKPFTT